MTEFKSRDGLNKLLKPENKKASQDIDGHWSIFSGHEFRKRDS